MTIRRDLEQLVSGGIARKVHGGAVLAVQVAHEPSFAAKRQLEQSAKHAIAARGRALIQPGAAIALSAGTTTWAMTRLIVAIPGVTVVTNSTTLADAVATLDPDPGRRDPTGGVRTPSAALVGPVADRTVATMHVDQLFLGVHGMDDQVGFTTPNLAEAATDGALIASRARSSWSPTLPSGVWSAWPTSGHSPPRTSSSPTKSSHTRHRGCCATGCARLVGSSATKPAPTKPTPQ